MDDDSPAAGLCGPSAGSFREQHYVPRHSRQVSQSHVSPAASAAAAEIRWPCLPRLGSSGS